MGGINCPPCSTNTSLELKEQYTSKLAKYCMTFFAGVAAFYSGNATIEHAVLRKGTVADAITLLEESASKLKDAQASLGSVAALVQVMSAQSTMDFAGQTENLGKAAKSVSQAAMELTMIPETSIQEAIWGRQNITETLGEAVMMINRATTWQAEFATNSSAMVTA